MELNKIILIITMYCAAVFIATVITCLIATVLKKRLYRYLVWLMYVIILVTLVYSVMRLA